MNRIRLIAVHTGHVGEQIKYAETVNIWFQAVFEDAVETLLLGIHHHNGQCNAVLTQVHTLVGVGHGKVVHMVVLQGVGNFHASGAVRKSLHHRHQLGAGVDTRTVVVEVADKGVEVYLHYGFVRLALEQFHNLFKMKHTRTLEQYGLVLKIGKQVVTNKIVGGGEKHAVLDELARVTHKRLANADEFGDAALFHKSRHLGIEVGFRPAGLHYVRHNERFFAVLPFLTHKVECYHQRIDIQTISIVYQQTVVNAFLHLHAHGHGCKAGHFRLYRLD